MKKQLKTTFVIASALVFSVKAYSQWAGSSGPSISTTKVEDVKKSSGKGLTYFGLEYGGFSKDYLQWMTYENTPGGAGFVTSSDYGEIKGAGFCIGKLINTPWKPLSVGVELTGAYYQQIVTYDWVTGSQQNIGWVGDMNSIYIGSAVPLRLRFVNNDNMNIYFQGNIGVAYIDVYDNHGESLMWGAEAVLYGGGSLGIKLAPVFLELGINVDYGNESPMPIIRVGVNW